jgi:hypothetical protein
MSRDLYNDKVEISVVTLIEMRRAFRALEKDDQSYIHRVFPDDYVFGAMKEIEDVYKNYMGESKAP